MKRLLCLNGLTRSEKESQIVFRHTLNVMNRMQIAMKVMDESHKYFDQFVALSKRMAEKAVNKAMVEKFLNGLYGSESKVNDKKKENIVELFQNGQGNNLGGGSTLWNLYNGATEHFNHHGSKTDDKRLESFHFGTGQKKNALAFDLAVSLL